MADTLNPDTAAAELKSLASLVAEGSLEQMRKLAEQQQARAKRQAAIADRLAAKLGEKHARVQALRRSGESGGRLAEQLGRAISRIEAARAVRPGSVLFSGRVTDAAGGAVARASVRLSDETGKLHVPGSAVTDERGEFTLAVPPDAFDRDAPGLTLVVEDKDTRIVGRLLTPLRLEPDVWQRVELTAATPVRPKKDTGGKPPRATARRRSARPPTK